MAGIFCTSLGCSLGSGEAVDGGTLTSLLVGSAVQSTTGGSKGKVGLSVSYSPFDLS